jgi:hypothetical protein
VEADPESLVLALRRLDVDPRHTVILESGEAVQSTDRGTAEPEAAGRESVRVTRYSANALDISVRAESAGWLVLTDAWYPGWEATVNGRPVAVEPANYAYRAVRVEAGEQNVSMQFRPSTWVWGRLISLVSVALGLLGLGALILWPRVRRRATTRA